VSVYADNDFHDASQSPRREMSVILTGVQREPTGLPANSRGEQDNPTAGWR
jgi:hypothetical protein